MKRLSSPLVLQGMPLTSKALLSLALSAVVLIAAFVFLASPLSWILLLFVIAVGVVTIFSRPLAVSAVLVIVGFAFFAYLQLAGFRSPRLVAATKYGAEIYPGFTFLCSADQNDDPLAGYENHPPLGVNEAVAVWSSSEGKVGFAGPPCQQEATTRSVISWFGLLLAPAYWGFLIRKRIRRPVFPEGTGA